MDKPNRQDHHNDQTKLAKKIKNFIYHPSDQIGSGFSSQVYKGINQLQTDSNKKNIAIKVIQLSKIQNQVENYLLNNQVNALKLLKHPNILQTIDILMTKNNVYIVTQFCEGGDLLKYIKNNGPFPEVKAMSLIKDIIEGYKNIEENNIIHRDLKTSNIFLSKGRAKIADFGFCQFIGQKKPQINYNVGSPAYMSPESYKQNQYSHKSDIWAIGIILYELLVGETPDRSLTYTQMANNLTSGKIKNIQNDQIRRILSFCFKRNIKERIDAIGLCQLVSMELGRLQSLNENQLPQYNQIENGQSQKIPNIPSSRTMSPSKQSKQLKFFKSQVSSYPKINSNQPTVQNNTSLNRIPPSINQSVNQPGRKSLKQRQQQKQNQLKPHTEYLLFLYRLLKFISQTKTQKIIHVLLPLFRHRSFIESFADQQYQQVGPQVQQFYKQFQYLKNRFDQVYLQLSKQPSFKNNIYKQKLDMLANVQFHQPQGLVLYRKIIREACGDCLQSFVPDSRGQQTANKSQLAIILDYLMIWHELLGLHLEGNGFLEVINIAKLQNIVKQQPKKLTPGHIQLLKIKYNSYFNQSQNAQKTQSISSESQAKQRVNPSSIPSTNSFQSQNSQMLPKHIQNFGPYNPQQIPQQGIIPIIPGVVPLTQLKNGFPPQNNMFGNVQYNNVPMPIHQSLMMPK